MITYRVPISLLFFLTTQYLREVVPSFNLGPSESFSPGLILLGTRFRVVYSLLTGRPDFCRLSETLFQTRIDRSDGKLPLDFRYPSTRLFLSLTEVQPSKMRGGL